MQKQLAMDHPSIWKFIEGIKVIQKGKDVDFEGMVRGDGPTVKHRKYRDIDNNILAIVQGGFENRTNIEYLRGLAHNFNMDK